MHSYSLNIETEDIMKKISSPAGIDLKKKTQFSIDRLS